MAAAKDPYRYFRIEAAELQEQLGQGILALEHAPDPAATVARLLRVAHTLKGAARVVKLPVIAEHAHALEDILTPLRDAAGTAPGRAQTDALLALHDRIGEQIAALGGPVPEAAEPTVVALAPAPVTTPVMAPVASPVLVPAWPPTSTPATPAMPPPSLQFTPAAPATLRPDDADLAGLLNGVAQAYQQLELLRRGLEQQPGGVDASVDDALDQMARALEQVRDGTERLSLTVAARLFTPLQRTVRDAAQALGKQAAFTGQGGEVRLHGEVLAQVQGALVQLVRNAVAHGIEPAAQRLAAGKPAQGRVAVRVWRMGRRVAFECSDDGAGLDLQALREQALRRGWIGASEQVADGQAALALLLRGGLSTAASVNELAGRGVGLDVVRDAAAQLGGEVQLRTERGHGTAVSLIVPLRLAALEVLQVQVAGLVVSLPLDAVRRTLRLAPQDVSSSPEGRSIACDGQVVPYAALADALGLAAAATGPGQDHGTTPDGAAQHTSVVLLACDAGLAALAVDRIIGIAHTTLRPTPELLPDHALVAGISLDVQGRPRLVLDPDGLAAFARAARPAAPAPAAPGLPLLVIDDSLTTRMLEQSILESAGYTVHAAVSAEEGLALARQQRYALFLVDVEMPGMDGFTFVERTRADPQLRMVPAVLVTSLNSPEHRQRGLDAGAAGYVVKGEFAQTGFLQLVRQLARGAA